MKEYLLALDLALGVTGYAVICVNTENGDVSMMEVGNINTHKLKERSAKLDHIGKTLLEIENRYHLKEVSFEQAFSRHIKSTAAIYSVVGVAQYVLHGYPQSFYAPSTVKKTATGAGGASKEEVALSMEEIFPDVDFENTDESDAVAVGFHHLKQTGVL